MKRPQTRVEPTYRTYDPRFVPTRGADVQATWRRLCGWTPPSAAMIPPPPEKDKEEALPPKVLRMARK